MFYHCNALPIKCKLHLVKEKPFENTESFLFIPSSLKCITYYVQIKAAHLTEGNEIFQLKVLSRFVVQSPDVKVIS